MLPTRLGVNPTDRMRTGRVASSVWAGRVWLATQASAGGGHRLNGAGPNFGRHKDRRRVATRYNRSPKVFLSAIAPAATVIHWLRVLTLSLQLVVARLGYIFSPFKKNRSSIIVTLDPAGVAKESAVLPTAKRQSDTRYSLAAFDLSKPGTIQRTYP